jgi:bisphosphoglycerate-independent phosphoglycerate mutase (AlkP superfamily)
MFTFAIYFYPCLIIIVLFIVLYNLFINRFFDEFDVSNIKNINNNSLLIKNKIQIYNVEYIFHDSSAKEMIKIDFKYKDINGKIVNDDIIIFPEYRSCSNKKIAKIIYNSYLSYNCQKDNEDEMKKYFSKIQNRYDF